MRRKIRKSGGALGAEKRINLNLIINNKNMAEEIETKILDIDKEKLEKKLSDIVAKRAGEVFFRSTSFDYPGFPLDKDMSWVRLRDDGKKITLAYKKRLGVTGVKG